MIDIIKYLILHNITDRLEVISKQYL